MEHPWTRLLTAEREKQMQTERSRKLRKELKGHEGGQEIAECWQKRVEESKEDKKVIRGN